MIKIGKLVLLGLYLTAFFPLVLSVGPETVLPEQSPPEPSGGNPSGAIIPWSSDSGDQSPENCEAEEPASRKRSADPREDVGPSSVRRRVDSLNAPERDELPESFSKAEEEELWLKSDEWVLKNLSAIENELQDEISKLRSKENMRSLAPERLGHIVSDLGEQYGLAKLPEILNDIKTNKLASSYYKETKALIRELDREGYNAKMIRKDWAGN